MQFFQIKQVRNGYILLHRQGLTQKEWKHPLRTLAWIDLLTLAAWEDFTNDDGVTLKRGEVIASETFLATRWRQNRGTVHRWLLYWESQQMVQRLVQHRSQQVPQRLFLLNYAKYQDGPQQVPQRLVQQVPQQVPQIMKVKDSIVKNKKENKERAEIKKFENLTEQQWKQLVTKHGWCDDAYADKTWDQSVLLAQSDREEFARKSRLMANYASRQRDLGRARVVFHEICGLVNDRGAMKPAIISDDF